METDKTHIKRPAVTAGLTYFGTLLLATFLTVRYTPILTVLVLCTLVALLIFRVHKRQPEAVLFSAAALLGLIAFNAAMAFTVLPAERFQGGPYRISAEITSEEEHAREGFHYTARIFRIDSLGADVNFSVRLSHSYPLAADIGDVIQCDAKLFALEEEPGLSFRTAQLAQGRVLSAYIADFDTIELLKSERRPFAYYLQKVRQHVRGAVSAALPAEEAAFLNAMLLGDQSGISDARIAQYRTAGASHILAISGMHMSIVAQLMLHSLCFLGLRRRRSAVCTVFFVLAFMGLSGLSETVVRSGIMQLIFLSGIAFGRRADALNSLCIAMLFLLLLNPFSVGDVSLLLSFSATLGIITLQPRLLLALTRRIENPVRRARTQKLTAPLATAVAAITGALPVQLYVFGTVSFSSVLSSLLVLYVSAWLIRFGLLAAVFVSVPFLEPLAPPFLLISGLLVRLQNALVAFVAEAFPWNMAVPGAWLQTTVLLGMLLLAASFIFCAARRVKLLAVLLAVLLPVLGAGAETFLRGREPRVLVLDTEFSACTAAVLGDSGIVLACAGSGTEIEDFLRQNGVARIELLHVGEGEEEIRCAEKLSALFETRQIFRPETVFFPSDAAEIYDYAGSLYAADYALHATGNGALLTLELSGQRIVLEQNDASFEPVQADILLTDNFKTKVNAPFTVLKTDAIIEEIAENLRTGDYVLTGAYPRVCVTLHADGTCTALGG